MKDKLLHEDQGCFEKGINIWATAPSSELKYWLKVNVPHIKRCLGHAAKQIQELTSDIRKFGFKRNTSSDPNKNMGKKSTTKTKSKDKNLKIGERITTFITRKVTYRSKARQTDEETQMDSTIQQNMEKFFSVRQRNQVPSSRSVSLSRGITCNTDQ